MATRRELLGRWRGIEEEEENDDDDNVDPSKLHRLHRRKEQWFPLFYFIICVQHQKELKLHQSTVICFNIQ